MKAFVITMDSLAALSLVFIAAFLLLSQTFQPDASRSIYLKRLSLDVLTVLEKGGQLGQAVEGNSTAVRVVLEAMPDFACMQLSLVDEQGDTVATMVKKDCGEVGLELQTTTKPLVHKGDVYMATLQSWSRK